MGGYYGSYGYAPAYGSYYGWWAVALDRRWGRFQGGPSFLRKLLCSVGSIRTTPHTGSDHHPFLSNISRSRFEASILTAHMPPTLPPN